VEQLRSQLESIASQFVSSLLAAMAGAQLADLADESAGQVSTGGSRRGRTARGDAPSAVAPLSRPKGRRKRASREEVEQQKQLALSTAKGLKPGFSKSDVMKKSGARVDLGRALSLLVADGKLLRKGERRMARYSVK